MGTCAGFLPRLLGVWGCLVCWASAGGGELASFRIAEPLGQNWTDEWLTQQVSIDLGSRGLRAGQLQLGADGQPVAAQFYRDGQLLADDAQLTKTVSLKILFKATVKARTTVKFSLTDQATPKRPWAQVSVAEQGEKTRVENGAYVVDLDSARPLPINAIRGATGSGSLAAFAWPEGAIPAAVRDQWQERGPARCVLRRTFVFPNAAHRYVLTLDFRAGDPWIDVTDEYALGAGSAIKLDLRAIRPDRVFHPFAYNARTFKPGGDQEDSTLQPPQHPVATLGPIWRDIWYHGGPLAFIYRSDGECGLGLAAVRGSQWDAPEGITLESQNLYVNGDAEQEGQIWVRLPTDGGRRHWAIIVGPPPLRKSIGRMIRSRADIPLEVVLKQWILDWPSAAPEVKLSTLAGTYLGGYFNQHQFNPTTFPRTVRGQIDRLKGPLKNRDLAALAYVFSNPDYWPGPAYRWRIGNPNFNTDMYNIYLKIGLLMPDHPHARRWVDKGIAELKTNLMRDSFPGGAWAESLSYSSFFFELVSMGQRVREAGLMDPFRQWPRYREVANYLACLHTPVDLRYGARQKAPIGDTSPGSYIERLNGMAPCFRGVDDRFAEQLARFPEKWEDALDLSSREFYGFGAMLRGNAYDERHESFVAVKAGPARNHFQGDELSFYFAGLGTPLALDYACHYSPRPWHAAMHNRPDMAGLRPVALAARRAFVGSEAADVFVADERTREINHVPLEPHLATKPGWEYPTTHLPEERPWTMRRYTMLVKHDPQRSRIGDYLVVRDEIDSPQSPWWNLHVLARDIFVEGQQVRFPGQLDVDVTAHFLTPPLAEIEKRQWGWRDASGSLRKTLTGADYEKTFFGAYIPENFQRGTWGAKRGKDARDAEGWKYSGEMGKWLRVKGTAGRSDWLVLIVPNLKGQTAPQVERLSATSARVTLGDESEVVHLGSEGAHQAAVERAGRLTVLLRKGEVRPWSELDFKPIPPQVQMGSR